MILSNLLFERVSKMADDVEAISGGEESMDIESRDEVVSASSAISSSDTVIDVISTGENN